MEKTFLTKNNSFLFEGVGYSFSNFYPSIIVEKTELPREDKVFISTEHYFMYQKAKFFKDYEIMRKLNLPTFIQSLTEEEKTLLGDIMSSKIGLTLDKNKLFLWKNIQNKIKQLGRKVKGFDANKWNEVKEAKMKQGLYLKFTQDLNLKRSLLNTGDKYIGEAAFWDREWGLGQNIENCYKTPLNQLGKNLLGKCLMEIREIISKE